MVPILVDMSWYKTFRTIPTNVIVHKIKHEVSEMCLCMCVGLLSTSSYFSP